ncbi:MAG: hypothetical protein WDZ40_01625 [Candidatus Spechtbacterales bacterium]
MKSAKYRVIGIGLVIALSGVLASCQQNDANVASRNLSQAADMFEINRRVVFFNGITDTYLLLVEGRCSIKADTVDGQLEVTCKVGPNKYKKHFLGLSDNVSYFVEQLDEADVSVYHYRVIFKPQTIVPDIDYRSSSSDE